MQAISSTLLSAIPPESLRKKLFQTSLGNPDLLQTISSTFPDVPLSQTMAVAAYTLGDLPSDKVRREVVRSLWDSGAEVIIVIDRGTPRGFDIVASARDQLLRLGRHSFGATRQTDLLDAGPPEHDMDALPEDDPDILELDGQTYYAEGTDAAASVMNGSDERGCFIVAPVCQLFVHVCRLSTGANKILFETVSSRRGLPSPQNERLLSFLTER